MTTRYDPTSNDEWLVSGAPSGLRAQSIRALDCNADLAALTTAVATVPFCVAT